MKQQTNLPAIEWKEVEVQNFANVITGGTPSTTRKEYWENGTIPWLPSGDLKNKPINKAHIFITKQGLDNSSTRLMPKNTVLIALTGATTGQIGITEIEACANQSVTGIIPSETHNPKYLFYFLQTIRKRVLSESYGGAQPHISQKYVKNIKIPIPFFNGKPDLETQKKIVSILEKAEKIKNDGKRTIELFNEYLNSVFAEMFGDPIQNSQNWKVSTIGESSTSIINGLYLPKEKYCKEGTAEMVHMSDVFYEMVIRGNLKQVMLSEKELDKYTLNQNDLLIARRSLNYEGAAKPCRIVNSKKPLVFESSLIKISPNLEKVLTVYLFYYLSSSRVRKTYIENCITGAVVHGINQGALRKIKLILPPVPIQKRFVSIVEHIEKLKEIQKQENERLNQIFDSLMQKAFRGELKC